MNLTKYWEVGKINLYNSLAYVSDLLANSFFIALIIFAFINLWQVLYTDGGLIEGFTINMLIWYLVMTEAIVTSQGRIIEEISDEVQSGLVAQSLNKPYNYILFKYSSGMGKTFFGFTLTFGIGSLVALTFLGGLKVSLATLPLIALSVFLAMTLNFLIMILLGIFGF